MYNKLENKQNNISYELLNNSLVVSIPKIRYQALFWINDLKNGCLWLDTHFLCSHFCNQSFKSIKKVSFKSSVFARINDTKNLKYSLIP